MTPPDTDPIGQSVETGPGPAVLVCRDESSVSRSGSRSGPALVVLNKRSDFQRASRGKRVAMSGFILQMLPRPNAEDAGIRVGYTCSKKVGNAVARNRAKRRLREIARAALPLGGQAGHDYVLVGRHGVTAALPYAKLLGDFEKALGILHGKAK